MTTIGLLVMAGAAVLLLVTIHRRWHAGFAMASVFAAAAGVVLYAVGWAADLALGAAAMWLR